MIGFESEEVQLRKLRDRLRTMSDEELIQFGKSLRNICRVKRVSATPDNFEKQLREARGKMEAEASEVKTAQSLLRGSLLTFVSNDYDCRYCTESFGDS